MISVIGQVHQTARDCGPITWGEASVREWLGDPELYAYLCDDGFLIYRWHDGNDAVFVEGAEAISGPALRAFWSLVGSHASIAEKVYARVSTADALWWLTRERDAAVTHRSMWMLRVVDAPAAVAARGSRRHLAQRPAGHRGRRPPGERRPLGADRRRGKGRPEPAARNAKRRPADRPGPPRPGRAVRRDPGRHAAPGRPGLGRLG